MKMESNEQTAIRLLKDLVSLQNGAPLERDKEEHDKLMNEIYSFLNDIADREIIESVFNSHSPTEPEFDTLQEGDYTEDLSRENFEYIIALEGDSCVLEWEEGLGLGLYGRVLVTDDYPQLELKTKLAPEEFLRRAENTFKTK